MQLESNSQTEHVVSGNDWQIMPRIYDRDINLSVIRRNLDPRMRSFIQGTVLTDRPLSIRQSIEDPKELPSLIPEHLREAPGARPWLEDMMMLVDAWFCLFDPKAVGVRLNTLTRTMCPRFHADRVMVRLLTTYGGPGTEWIPNEEVDRVRVGRPLVDNKDPLAQCDRIQRLEEGDVGLFKGEIWPDNEGNGAVHRSPSIMAGDCRLLFSLDIV